MSSVGSPSKVNISERLLAALTLNPDASITDLALTVLGDASLEARLRVVTLLSALVRRGRLVRVARGRYAKKDS